MGWFLFLGFLWLLIIAVVNGQNETQEYDPSSGKLLFLHTIWVHGTRGPYGNYPTSVYNETTFYPGYGELLAKGMAEQFVLGGKLRERYITKMNFISKTFNMNEIYIRSSDFNRTIVSAICNMCGFYSPSATEGTNYPKNSRWPRGFVPVPVHTVPFPTDYVFNHLNACPVQIQLQNLYSETPSYLEILENTTELFDFLKNKSGLDTSTISNKMGIADTVLSEDSIGLQMTDWARDSLPNLTRFWSTIVAHSVGIDLENYKNFTLGHEISKTSGGPILTEIIGRMNEKFNNYLNYNISSWIKNLKYYAYSGHETNVLSLFAVLGIQHSDVYSDAIVPTSSTVCLELWVDKNNNTDVKVLYLRGNSTVFQDITSVVVGCEHGCSLKKFENRSISYLWNTPNFCNYQYEIPK